MQVYLDNSATTQPTENVIAAMTRAMREEFYNPSSLYMPALDAQKSIKRCRKRVLDALNTSAGRVIFTSGGTEANNLAIYGLVETHYGIAHVAYTAQEHPSVIEVCENLKKQGHKVTIIPIDPTGQPRFDVISNLLSEKPTLISCMHVNNETGCVPNLQKISELIREKSRETRLHVDGVQGFMRVPIDMSIVDFYVLSAHKINGPKGIGALWMRDGLRISPRATGGGQEDNLRSGTENTPGIAGLMAAIEEYGQISDLPARLFDTKGRLWDAIQSAVPEVVLNSPPIKDAAPHILNASFPGVRAEVMLHALEAEGIYVSTGAACSSKKRNASHVLLAMGLSPERTESALRFSISPFTKIEEIAYLADRLGSVYTQLKRFKRR